MLLSTACSKPALCATIVLSPIATAELVLGLGVVRHEVEQFLDPDSHAATAMSGVKCGRLMYLSKPCLVRSHLCVGLEVETDVARHSLSNISS